MSTHAFKTSIRTESQTKRTTNYYYDNDCNVMETHSPSLHFILQCSRGYLNKLHSSVEWNFRQKCNLSDKNKKKPHRFYLCNGLPSSSGNNLNYFPSWSKAGSYLAGKTLRRRLLHHFSRHQDVSPWKITFQMSRLFAVKSAVADVINEKKNKRIAYMSCQ